MDINVCDLAAYWPPCPLGIAGIYQVRPEPVSRKVESKCMKTHSNWHSPP